LANKEDFQIKSDSPVADDLMFWRVVGHEALSRPSIYELTVISKNKTIEAKDILGHAFDVVIEFLDPDGNPHKRHCQGHAIRFTRVSQIGRYYRYEISLQSWFGLLSKRSNSRIHQDSTVINVFNAVLDDSPIKRVKKFKIDGVIGKHQSRRYCVQHQESDYTFLSRLLEDEGIYYWFDSHEAPGTMYLADASDAAHDMLPVTDILKYIPGGTSDARHNEITKWISTRQLETGKFASRDSDFKAIKKKLSADKGDPDTHELADLEAFEFEGGYFKDDDTDGIAKLRLDELVTRRQRHWALTSWPDVTAGRSFTLADDPDGNRDGDYLIAACSFVVSHPGYEGITLKEEPRSITHLLHKELAADAVNADTQVAYSALIDSSPTLRTGQPGARAFMLTVLPLALPYRVPRLTPQVVMPGPQSAIVVGPEGEEIHADDFGRVKVHFHWDRYDKSNEKSTCWVRVSQPWAGKGWGGYFIPRIGQEVIVDFLNGDPDRPIIVGRVYNDDQPKPFDSHTQSGFRTRSTPKGSAANCNEFRFDDKKGSEQVYLHAEKNQDISVENDETHTVGHDRTKTIDHDETNHIKNDRKETVDNNETIKIGVDRNESVGANETIEIGTNRTEKVGANEKIDIGANRTETVGGSESVTVAANQDIKVGANQKVMVGASRTDTVGGGVTQTIGGSLTQTVVGGITINTPGKMMVTALGGVTFIAPGGTKFVDFQFNKLGGLSSETYGTKLDNYSLKTEVTGIALTARGINLQKIGVDNKKAELYVMTAAIRMMVETGFAIGKAPVHITKADIEIHG
jgi:type VI secretion system secreted protein VgrG